MRLADDRRARIPFALLGVLLLVGSATYATTLGVSGPVRRDDSVDTAMERADASTTTALRSAVKDAAQDAARQPVTTPADTPAGRALNDSSPFRDALRIRIYLAAQGRLETTRHRRGDVVAVTSLPPVSTVSDLRTAKRRIGVERADTGTAMRVTVRNVSVTARRDGHVVARDDRTVTLTVATPVLLAHDRTEKYERRLNRGPLAGPGLGQRLTARINPVVWSRGAGQYAGAPIENVLGNRHIELSTNGGALGTQRAVFGRDDPRARHGLRRATAHVGVQDLHAGATTMAGCWTSRVYPPSPIDVVGTGSEPRLAESGPSANRTMSVGVNRTADVAFVDFLTVSDGRSLPRVLRESYRSEARLLTDVEQTRDREPPERRPPDTNWTLVEEEYEDRYDVRVASARPPAGSDTGDAADAINSERFAAFNRRVIRHNRVVRVWRRGNQTKHRVHRWRDGYRVSVAVVSHYRPQGVAPAQRVAPAAPETVSAPTRPVRPVFEYGGALDGPNLAGVPATATDRLLDRNRDAVAVDAVEGELDETSTVVYGRRPAKLAAWVYRNVSVFRERIRNVSVEANARDGATGRVNFPALLADRLRERRAELVDAPATYDGVADRARTAARAAYLDRVIASLDRRAENRRESNAVLDDALEEAGVGSGNRLAGILEASEDVSRPRYRKVGRGGPGESVALTPDGSPGYLTLSAVSDEHIRAIPDGASYRPLTARNVNVFAVPYGDATDGVLTLFDSDPQVDLRTAGSTLVAANNTLERTDNRTLERRRDALRRSMHHSLAVVVGGTRRVVVREASLTRRDHRAAVRAAFARWDGTGHRALAAANGSFARALAAEVRERGNLTARESDRLAVRLRVTVGRSVRQSRAKVPRKQANETSQVVRDYAHQTAKKYLTAAAESGAERAGERAARRVIGETARGVPAGLPVAPAPGYWYATVNVWWVTVRGSYLRFTVRAYSGSSDGTGTSLQYVRDGSVVTLDVDSDGDPERLGRNERISFETQAAAAIVVPGGNWVGDVDGDADERSTGWADGPGCVNRSESACRAD